MLFPAARLMHPNMWPDHFFGCLDLMQPMPQSICAYVCAYVYLCPNAMSPARGVTEFHTPVLEWGFRDASCKEHGPAGISKRLLGSI